MICAEYSELVFNQHLLNNIKNRNSSQESEWELNKKKLVSMELKLPSKDIIESVKDAFKHIPPRN